jgi:hypothetical protein
MTGQPDTPTERFDSPPPPPPPAKSSRFANFRSDPSKVFIAAAVLAVFGFGALTFTAGYWAGHGGQDRGRMIEHFGGPAAELRGGPMSFRHERLVVPPDVQEESPTTTEPAPTTTANP